MKRHDCSHEDSAVCRRQGALPNSARVVLIVCFLENSYLYLSSLKINGCAANLLRRVKSYRRIGDDPEAGSRRFATLEVPIGWDTPELTLGETAEASASLNQESISRLRESHVLQPWECQQG